MLFGNGLEAFVGDVWEYKPNDTDNHIKFLISDVENRSFAVIFDIGRNKMLTISFSDKPHHYHLLARDSTVSP